MKNDVQYRKRFQKQSISRGAKVEAGSGQFNEYLLWTSYVKCYSNEANAKPHGWRNEGERSNHNYQCTIYSLGEGGAVSLFSLNSGTGMPGLSPPTPPPPAFFPTSLLTYSPTPKIPFTLLTPVFNLSPPATSTVCSLGNTVTPLPSLLVTPQRKGGRKSPELNEHSVLQQSGGCV